MKRIIEIVLSLLICCHVANGQDVEQVMKADPVSFSGGVTWSNIFVWPKDSAVQTPTYSYYISGSLSTTVMGLVSVPVSFAYTNNKMSSTITYPFNRFTLTPSYKWVKLHIGYSQMTFSPYTMSGHDFLGGGIELTPTEMPWKFSAYLGRYNKAAQRDSINTEPIYKRVGGGVLAGFKTEKLEITINATMAKDDESSLSFAEGIDTTYIAPQSNLAGGISLMAKPWEQTTISGEYAMSIVNSNCKADSTGHVASFFDEDINVTRFNAGKVSISQSFGIGSAGLTYERVSPNYKSFSSYYNTNDFENITADFSIGISQKVNLNANVGIQRDNLSKQEVNTNSQLIYSASVGVNATEKLSLNGSVSNMQSYVHIKDILEKVTQTNQYQNLDTLSFTELSFSASGSANYHWGDGEEANWGQAVCATYSYQQASHEQENCQKYVSNRLHNYNASYQVHHKPTKVNCSLSANYNTNHTPESKTDVLTLGASTGASIAEKVRTSLSVNYSKVDASANSRIINTRLSADYSFLKYNTINCSLTVLNSNADGNKTQFTANVTYSLSLGYTVKRKANRNKE